MQWNIKFVFLKLIFSLFISFSFAQTGTDAIDFSLGVGTVVRNHPDFPDIVDNAYTGSLTFSRHYNGYKPWHRYYNYPRVGLNFTTASLGNDAILGYLAGAMCEMSFEKPIGKRFYRAVRLSLGAAWFSNPHNQISNPDNVAMGSRIAFLPSAEYGIGFRLSKNWWLTGKAALIHSSNSHYKLPNLGINLPEVALGVRYRFANDKVPLSDSIQLEHYKKIRFNVRMALGINESGSSTSPVNGPKYPIYLGSVTISKMFSPINKVSAGIEVWYNKGVYDFIVSQEFYDSKRHQRSTSAAIVLSHEFLMGHWGLVTTGGIYLYNPFYRERLKRDEIDGFKDKLKSHIPARLGIQYHLKNTNYRDSKNAFVGVYIKSNFGQADFLEMGWGWIF